MAKFITVSYQAGTPNVLQHNTSVSVSIWNGEKEAVDYCQAAAAKGFDLYRFELTAGTKTARHTPPVKEESFPI